MRFLGLALCAATVLLVACGGADDEATTSQAAPAAQSQAQAADSAADAGAPEEEAAGVDGADRVVDDGTAAGARGAAGLVDAAECRFLADPTVVLQPGGETDLEEVAAAWQAIADRAPAEIADAVRTLADAFTELATLAAEVDLTDPQALADPENQEAIEQIGALLEAEGLQAAAAEASAWFAAHCAEVAGVSLAEEADTTGEPEPGAAGRPSAPVPDGFPETLWLPQGLEVLSATAARGEWNLTAQVRGDDPQVLAEAFEAELSAAGWDVGARETRADDSIQIAVRGFDTRGFVQISQPPFSSRLLIFVALVN